MILNSYIRPDDFSDTFAGEITYLRSLGYGDLNNDALWKWSAILYSLRVLEVKHGSRICDIGGGRSPLTKIISNFHHITNVDKYPGGNWFPLNREGDYAEAQGTIVSKESNIEYVDMDFFDWSRNIEDNSYDVMHDSCSVIHFNNSSADYRNDGCHAVGEEVKRLLKPGGYYIVVSDLLHPMYRKPQSMEGLRGEFLFLDVMMDLYRSCGLSVVGDTDADLHNDFFTNILIDVRGDLPNYKRLNHIPYGLADWQTFSNYEGTCRRNLVRGRMVFRKE